MNTSKPETEPANQQLTRIVIQGIPLKTSVQKEAEARAAAVFKPGSQTVFRIIGCK